MDTPKCPRVPLSTLPDHPSACPGNEQRADNIVRPEVLFSWGQSSHLCKKLNKLSPVEITDLYRVLLRAVRGSDKHIPASHPTLTGLLGWGHLQAYYLLHQAGGCTHQSEMCAQ